MKNEKGITLIALILVILVLLVLAGISVMLVINNESDVEGPANKLEYNKQVFEDSYNEYKNTLVEGTDEDNALENTSDVNSTVVNQAVEDLNTVTPSTTNTTPSVNPAM